MNNATQAKYSKEQVSLGVIRRFPRSILALARVSEFGCQKHGVEMGSMGFLTVPNAETVYLEAEGRHMVREAIEGPVNLDPKDGGLLHKAQKAWNALADLEVALYQAEMKQPLPPPVSRDTETGRLVPRQDFDVVTDEKKG